MQGYIHYDNASEYSPFYPYPLGRWPSAGVAIESGQDPASTILLFVSLRKDIFYPMREYVFVGRYGDLINEAIQTLYIPKMEEIDIDAYIYPIPRPNIPTITISRFIYELRREGIVYRQVSPLPVIDEYGIGTITVSIDGVREDVPVYIGKKGSFILLHHIPRSIELL